MDERMRRLLGHRQAAVATEPRQWIDLARGPAADRPAGRSATSGRL